MNLHRDWQEHVDWTPSRWFRRTYRVSKEEFKELFEILEPRLRLKHATKYSLSPENRLALTLRFLAKGSYLDLWVIYNICPHSVYPIVWSVVEAIIETFEFEFPIDNPEKLDAIGAGFAQRSKGKWKTCVGALDGISIRIQPPSPSECGNPKQYYCRKGFYSVNMQAICDSNYIFRYASISTAGSTHDATAFATTPLCQQLEAGVMARGYWIAADDAYKMTTHIITPYTADQLRRGGEAEDAFNYYQSSTRIHIEQAFGMLVQSWRILHHPLQVGMKRIPQVVRAALCLHNFTRQSRMSHGVPENIPAVPSVPDCGLYYSTPVSGDMECCVPLLSSQFPTAWWPQPTRTASQLREDAVNMRNMLRDIIADAGLTRVRPHNR